MFGWGQTTVALALIVVTSLTLLSRTPMFSRKKWDPRGQHCYVTGGSAGLGLALAILLTRKGADVSIVARNEGRLKKALELMEAERQTPNQLLKSYSYSLHDATAAKDALEAACKLHGGKCPDAVFLCAGSSTPGFFVEQDEASLRHGMDNTYWAAAWTTLAAAKRMVRHHAKGKIVFVSSVLGYFSIIGYSSYSPGKFAIRGLAETLRSELQLYPIDVHIFFPGTIYSPGYENENKTKPKVTLKIEESDEGLHPEQAAIVLFKGVQKNNFHISADFNGNIFRTTTKGPTPMNNVLVDCLYALLGFIALPVWRWSVDKTVVDHRKDHLEYLEERGFFRDDTVDGNGKVQVIEGQSPQHAYYRSPSIYIDNYQHVHDEVAGPGCTGVMLDMGTKLRMSGRSEARQLQKLVQKASIIPSISEEKSTLGRLPLRVKFKIFNSPKAGSNLDVR